MTRDPIERIEEGLTKLGAEHEPPAGWEGRVTHAGRMQTVLEWAQAGVVSMDEARRLMQHPDIDRSLSVYTAALEADRRLARRKKLAAAVAIAVVIALIAIYAR